MIEKLKKSVKIKTWYTKEEVFKFSSFLYETDLDANMVRYWDSKSTCKSLFDDKIIRLVQRWDFESLRSRTYVFTGSKRLNKTHFEDEFGEQGWFSNIQNKSLKSYRKSHKSLKYRSSTLTWDQPLPSGIHESNPCMSHAAWVNFNIFSNQNLKFKKLYVFYWNRLNWFIDIAVCGFPINSREFPERVTMSKPNDFVEHNKLTGWIQIIWIKLITYLYKSLQYNKEVCPSGISEQPQPGTVRPSQLRPSV